MPPPIFKQFISPCNDPNFRNLPSVTGVSLTSPQAGVFGLHCAGGNGVQGQSSSGVAVRGDSESFLGVFGRSLTSDGIQGRSAAPDHAGVSAINEGSGFGLFASSDGGGLAGVFAGPVKVGGDLEVTGDINGHETSRITCFDVSLIGGDCAEDFDIDDVEKVEPGTVMVINESGALRECKEGYNKRVVGVISGAGDYKPGIVLDKQRSANNRKPIALLGKVFCKVDAQYGAVEMGDLLTTSPTSGHAMKAENPLRAFGAVIGKALRPLAAGQALIPILIALQ